MQDREIIVVSGLPRSGTSMMMKMLEAGGLPLLTDGLRKPDEDNPGGYYEFERVKKVKQDPSWLEEACGKGVKIISRLLYDLPDQYGYKVIFMQREMDEVLASQRAMLARRGSSDPEVDDAEMGRLFARHLEEVARWLEEQPNFQVLYVEYARVLEDPRSEARRVGSFLGLGLDVEAMAGVVD